MQKPRHKLLRVEQVMEGVQFGGFFGFGRQCLLPRLRSSIHGLVLVRG
jgi:hypothetical protein